jgi:hypothetical protein
MGFYIRKSLKAGPFRFNLSKSGIGVSTGIPGFRVGSGPRGNYVHMGTHGLYYRASLNGPRPATRSRTQPRQVVSGYSPTPPPRPVYAQSVEMEDITGADVHSLQPTGGGDLVQQLNDASGRIRLALPTAIVLFIAGCCFLPWGLILWALAVPLVWWLALRDNARKSVVVFYDVNDAQAEWYQHMVDACNGLASAQAIWRIVQQGQTANPYQRKVNAGAGTLVNRIPSHAHLTGPKVLVTNVAVPTIEAGKTSVHFLPERILVRDQKRFTDVSYDILTVTPSTTRFIESSTPPRDAAQVGTTWQYVNKNGGPDRRFSNNRQLPVMQYGELALSTSGGFRWELQASLVTALQQAALVLKQHRPIPLIADDAANDKPPATIVPVASKPEIHPQLSSHPTATIPEAVVREDKTISPRSVAAPAQTAASVASPMPTPSAPIAESDQMAPQPISAPPAPTGTAEPSTGGRQNQSSDGAGAPPVDISGRRSHRALTLALLALSFAVAAGLMFCIGGVVTSLNFLLVLGLIPTTVVSAVLSVLAIVFAATSMRSRVMGVSAVQARRGLTIGIVAFCLPGIALVTAAIIAGALATHAS